MKNRILLGLALKNIKANQTLQIPFVLASGIMSALFYIMVSLINNDYVQSRHSSLISVMEFGSLVTAIVLIVFSLYANRFLMGRRKKELALYGVLGLEKKHVGRILFIEQCINTAFIVLIAICGGYFIGKLVFLSGNLILQDKGIAFSNYLLEAQAVQHTLQIVGLNAVLAFAWNLFKIQLSNPIQLMSGQNAGEKEPRFHVPLLIIGSLMMGVGYYIALTVEGSLQSLVYFFLAILFVIAGTYALFGSLSILVLKMLKRNKSYYYRPVGFITTSGMLYRMKSNAVGLASICILCSGLIVALATTTSIYATIGDVVDHYISREYRLNIFSDLSKEYSTQEEREKGITEMIENTLQGNEKIRNIDQGVQMTIIVDREENRINAVSQEELSQGDFLSKEFMVVYTLQQYNRLHDQNLVLEKGQIGYQPIRKKDAYDTLYLMGEEFQTKIIENAKPLNGIMNENNIVIVPDTSDVQKIAAAYDFVGKKNQPSSLLSYVVMWDVENSESDYVQRASKVLSDENMHFETREQFVQDIYSLNGGFVLLGIIIGIVFLIAIMLVLYYKQISEGYEDRQAIQIMKKVGLSDELIKKTTNIQLIWLFFLPLIVAIVHMTGAFKILYQLIGLFGLRNPMLFLLNISMVTAIFAVIYYLMFKITSKIYRSIVE